jgi:hypothetical protein
MGMKFGTKISKLSKDELVEMFRNLNAQALKAELSQPAQEALSAIQNWAPAIGLKL